MRSLARYLVRGFVLSSSSIPYDRRFSCCLATLLFGSLRSPKTIACVGQVWAHAETISPSRTERFSLLAWIFVASIHGARPWNRRLWKMIAGRYPVLDEVEVSHGSGKFWTIKVLAPKEVFHGS